jgi:glutathione peroxidase
MNMQTAHRSVALFLGFGLVVASATALPGQPADQPAPQTSKPGEPKSDGKPVSPYVLGHSMKDIDGKPVDLSAYKGKVVLFVNVASKCGYTRQYAGLEALHQAYKDKGLVVVGIPSNDFGGQEPGTESEIKEFCSTKYKVTFPMMGKIAVTGANAHPLYKQLAAQPGVAGGEPKWNFNKYLVDREGNVVEHFESGVKPDADELKKKIEGLLAAKPSEPAAAKPEEKPAAK